MAGGGRKRPRSDTHDRIEDLALYRYAIDLTNYMLTVLEGFPKKERFGLTMEIKASTLRLLRDTIITGVDDDKAPTLMRLNYEMKYLKALVRVAFLKKYINEKRLEVWASKITEADKIVVGWTRRLGASAQRSAEERSQSMT